MHDRQFVNNTQVGKRIEGGRVSRMALALRPPPQRMALGEEVDSALKAS